MLGDLVAALGGPASHSLASDAFAALAAGNREFGGMSYDSLGLKGAVIASARQGATA